MDRRITKALMARAKQQHGLLGPADVGAIDPSRTLDELVRSGVWQYVLPDVVAPAGVTITAQLLEAAAMLWIPRSMLSHQSAARHKGFWVPDDDHASLITPYVDGRRRHGDVIISRTRQYPETQLRRGLFRYSQADRTIVDLAQRLTRRQLAAALLSAIRHKATTAEDVRAVAQTLTRRPTVQLVMDVVALWTAERESMLEDRLYGDVCSVVPTHEVERQVVVENRDGSIYARIDVAVRKLMLAFEGDGLLFHSTDEQIAADQRRDRGLFVRGWHTTRFREGVLDDRSAVRHEIQQVVDQRRRDLGKGWAA